MLLTQFLMFIELFLSNYESNLDFPCLSVDCVHSLSLDAGVATLDQKSNLDFPPAMSGIRCLNQEYIQQENGIE